MKETRRAGPDCEHQTCSDVERKRHHLSSVNLVRVGEDELGLGLVVKDVSLGLATVRVSPLRGESSSGRVQSPDGRQIPLRNVREWNGASELGVGLTNVRRRVVGVLGQQAAVDSAFNEFQNDVTAGGGTASRGTVSNDQARVVSRKVAKDSSIGKSNLGASLSSDPSRCSSLSRSENGSGGPLDRGQGPKIATKTIGVGLPSRKLRSISAGSRNEDGCQESEERDQGASLLHDDG